MTPLQHWIVTVVPLLGPRATVETLAAHAKVSRKRVWLATTKLRHAGKLTRTPLPSRGRPAYCYAVVA